MEFRKDTGTRTEIKDTGISRKVDELGRIVLPVEIRRLFGMNPGNQVVISINDGRIMICPLCCRVKGMVRKIDDLGRFVIPIEIRRDYCIEEGDRLNILVSDNAILLVPPHKCIFCGSPGKDGHLIELESKMVCNSCLSKLIKANKKSTCAAGTAADGEM